jgi:hypothetical protein
MAIAAAIMLSAKKHKVEVDDTVFTTLEVNKKVVQSFAKLIFHCDEVVGGEGGVTVESKAAELQGMFAKNHSYVLRICEYEKKVLEKRNSGLAVGSGSARNKEEAAAKKEQESVREKPVAKEKEKETEKEREEEREEAERETKKAKVAPPPAAITSAPVASAPTGAALAGGEKKKRKRPPPPPPPPPTAQTKESLPHAVVQQLVERRQAQAEAELEKKKRRRSEGGGGGEVSVKKE